MGKPIKLKVDRFCLSCYGAQCYFSAPLRASESWLKKTLKRANLINGMPLRKRQFEALRRRLGKFVEIGWSDGVEYYLEGVSL